MSNFRIESDMSVVIPTLGRAILEECLAHIAAGTHWPAEIIVVDQSSSEDVAAWVEAANKKGLCTRHVLSSERGKSAAVNRGIEHVTTKSFAVTDDDCFVASDWVATMAAHIRANPKAIITGPAHARTGERPVSVVTVSRPVVSRRPRLRYDLFCGSNMGATLTAMSTVGAFDEDPCFYAAAEDCEWAYRALRRGVEIIYRPDLIVYHVGWRTENERYERYQLYARSHGSFYGKYLRQGDPLIAARALTHYLRALRRWIRGLVTADRERTLAGRAYVTGLLPGVLSGLRRGSTR